MRRARELFDPGRRDGTPCAFPSWRAQSDRILGRGSRARHHRQGVPYRRSGISPCPEGLYCCYYSASPGALRKS